MSWASVLKFCGILAFGCSVLVAIVLQLHLKVPVALIDFHPLCKVKHSDLTAQTFNLSNGHILGFAEFGRSGGTPIFAFHGTPGSRLDYTPLHEKAAILNFRILSIDRPGIGLSSQQEGRALLDWPAQVVELADYLRIKKFSVLGHSGGGAYALACAKFLSDQGGGGRLNSVIISAGARPPAYGQEGRKSTARFMWWLLAHFPSLWEWVSKVVLVQPLLSNHSGTSEERIVRINDLFDSPVDICAAEQHLLLQSTRYLQCIEGQTDDHKIFLRDWGFEVGSIKIGKGSKICSCYGSKDINAPLRLEEATANELNAGGHGRAELVTIIGATDKGIRDHKGKMMELLHAD